MMKKIHNIHNHKIRTKEGFVILPNQTIWINDEGKALTEKPEEKKYETPIDLSDYVKKEELPEQKEVDLSIYATIEYVQNRLKNIIAFDNAAQELIINL